MKTLILAEDSCLSQESARGFSSVPLPGRELIIVCAAGSEAASRVMELRRRAIRGAWIIWEHSPLANSDVAERLNEAFDITVGARFQPGMLIRYDRPQPTWTRSFLACTPAECAGALVIAHHQGKAVCLKRRFGLGGMIYVGSLLGPNLWAEEPQAHAIARSLLATL